MLRCACVGSFVQVARHFIISADDQDRNIVALHVETISWFWVTKIVADYRHAYHKLQALEAANCVGSSMLAIGFTLVALPACLLLQDQKDTVSGPSLSPYTF